MDNFACLGHLFVTVFLYTFAAIIMLPAIVDVTMAAVCPGRDECSLAIYLTGFQQAIIGVGTSVAMPVIGKLSDVYGRKALLTLPMALAIIPTVILAYDTTTNYFYAYYALRTLTAMVSDGSALCLALAYAADNISECNRISAFGILSGISSAAFVFSTLAARFLPTPKTFQVAAIVYAVAVVYMRLFLKDSRCSKVQSILKTGLLESTPELPPCDQESSKTIPVFKTIPSPRDLFRLLKGNTTLTRAAFVVFFHGLAEGGIQSSLMFFLKARFQFQKDQFADIFLVGQIGATISQLLFMPLLAPIFGEEKLLSIGLLTGFISMLLNSIAWTVWDLCFQQPLQQFTFHDWLFTFRIMHN